MCGDYWRIIFPLKVSSVLLFCECKALIFGSEVRSSDLADICRSLEKQVAFFFFCFWLRSPNHSYLCLYKVPYIDWDTYLPVQVSYILKMNDKLLLLKLKCLFLGKYTIWEWWYSIWKESGLRRMSDDIILVNVVFTSSFQVDDLGQTDWSLLFRFSNSHNVCCAIKTIKYGTILNISIFYFLFVCLEQKGFIQYISDISFSLLSFAWWHNPERGNRELGCTVISCDIFFKRWGGRKIFWFLSKINLFWSHCCFHLSSKAALYPVSAQWNMMSCGTEGPVLAVCGWKINKTKM